MIAAVGWARGCFGDAGARQSIPCVEAGASAMQGDDSVAAKLRSSGQHGSFDAGGGVAGGGVAGVD